MSKNEGEQNIEMFNKKQESKTYKNQSRNKKNEKNEKDNNSQISTKEISPRNNSLTTNEENILVKIMENHNNSSISKICEFFNQSNLNYSQIHSKNLYDDDKNNFIYNNIIKNNFRRINSISEKLSSMKNPDEISTKESFICGYINNKSRNYNKSDLKHQVKLTCCFFNDN
jgi:hypothetical protein